MRLSLRALLAATTLVPMSAAAELAAITPEPWPAPIGCHLKGVAVHTFYGRTSDLQRYWNDLSARAVASRLQILLVESMNGEAEVHVFEQSSGRNYTVSSWRGEAVANLRSDWDEKIFKSRGSSCAGLDLKADIEQRGMRLVANGSVEHVSASGTFLPIVSRASGYLRVTVYHPCD